MRKKVVYQIYPRSFKDSNGDGIGDVKGIIEKLDYLRSLGVDYLWLTPIFISPQNDNGYDVENYYEIDSRFGTMSDVEELIEQANQRGIDIMFDMVLNHTSTNHEWFQKALAGDKKFQDYYIFRKETTNWQSKFGGNAWQYVPDLELYYLHLFDVTQADLNWDNPEVFTEVCKIVNFWLDKGVKGLRFDVVNLISKPAVFEDDYVFDGRRFYTDGPHVHEYLHNLNRHTFGRYDNILTVGEMSSTSIENGVKYAKPEREELSMIFNFHHLKVDYKDNQKWVLKDFDFIELKSIWRDWQLAMQENDAYSAVFYNNHDQPRVNSRFGDVTNYWYESSTMLGTSIHMLRGMPYLFQGEEIGMPNAYFDSIDDYVDVESTNMYKILMAEHQDEEKVLHILQERSRDNSRTPIPWDNTQENYGFTTGTPWLSFSKFPNLKSVKEDVEANNSVFKYYQKLIQLRKEQDVISDGTIEFHDIDHPQLFVYERRHKVDRLLVITNHYDQEVKYTLQFTGEVLLSNVKRTTVENDIVLKPYEALVILKKG